MSVQPIRFTTTDDLLGQRDVADLLGVKQGTVSSWIYNGTNGFPDPIVKLSCGDVYSRTDIEKWWESYRPRSGPYKRKKPLTWVDGRWS